MRLVVDTNVIVSALLSPGRAPDLALAAAQRACAVLLVDAHIEAEYRSVLGRPKFDAIDGVRRDALLASLLATAEQIVTTRTYDGAMIDPDDRGFIEVALSGRADAIVTGNGKHYPRDVGVAVIGPAELLSILSSRAR